MKFSVLVGRRGSVLLLGHGGYYWVTLVVAVWLLQAPGVVVLALVLVGFWYVRSVWSCSPSSSPGSLSSSRRGYPGASELDLHGTCVLFALDGSFIVEGRIALFSCVCSHACLVFTCLDFNEC